MKRSADEDTASAFCKKCGGMPKAERQRIQDEEFLYNALEQKVISQKNAEYFKEMRLRYSDELGEKAAVMVELCLVHPRKKKRYGFLYHNKHGLYDRMVRLNLIEDWITKCAADAEQEERMIGAHSSLTEDSENETIFFRNISEMIFPFNDV